MENSVFRFSFDDNFNTKLQSSFNMDKVVSSFKSGNGSYISSASLLSDIHNKLQRKDSQDKDTHYQSVMMELIYRANTISMRDEIFRLKFRLVLYELIYKKMKVHSDWYVRFWESMK